MAHPSRIDIDVANEYFIEGRVLFIDARPQPEHGQAVDRIPGSVEIDPGSGAAMDQRLLELPAEMLIVAYCDEPAQAASTQIARRARELARGDVCVLAGGYRAWKQARLPTEPVPRPSHELSPDRAPGYRHPHDRVTALLDALSPSDLDRLCRLAFWMGLTEDHSGLWEDSREGRERVLAGVDEGVVKRFIEFLQMERDITVPEEHEKRVANLPLVVVQVALSLNPRRFLSGPVNLALAELIPATDSELLIRWATWTGEIPRHAVWWYTPLDERPV